ncbi:SDR family oxidoreductase [Sphingoaurantiacus capsulatus]|uniref:SDR family oxidoreductase n=1 Tax=Sphingoaurantiacus capsulatus TaxID=1771310 RepID=A0ABV7XC19_9SPHN
MADAFKDQVLAGKVAYIAGGSSGINLGIAQRLAAQGAKVAIVSRSQDKIDAAVKTITDAGGTAWGTSVDVRDYAGVETSLAATRDKFGEIDVLVSGAAGNFLAPVVGMSANAFKTVVDIDLIGTFNVFRACFDYVKKPGASLIAITAGQGTHPMMFQAHACAAKAGINMLTRVLAMEWGPAGIRVNGISPGPISETEGMQRLAASPAAEAALKGRIPLRDYGTKRDIADMALYLASDNAAYITGAILDVDGGSSLGDASPNALTPPKR